MSKGMKDAVLKGEGGMAPTTRSSTRSKASNHLQAAFKKSRPKLGKPYPMRVTRVVARPRRQMKHRRRWGSLRKVGFEQLMCGSEVDLYVGAPGNTTGGTSVKASDQVTNMQTGSADHLDLGPDLTKKK